eukprot:TRINITY_DN4425_c0_g2_i1.p1 TRINITY_DN4425_c0_g2~~TRINITY_DN4425_c0_g2_i1.p1  ORF type:complete len:140 (-),score=32.92 TRINITY_DN4425_c0_g2_i1:117-536(-)
MKGMEIIVVIMMMMMMVNGKLVKEDELGVMTFHKNRLTSQGLEQLRTDVESVTTVSCVKQGQGWDCKSPDLPSESIDPSTRVLCEGDDERVEPKSCFVELKTVKKGWGWMWWFLLPPLPWLLFLIVRYVMWSFQSFDLV